MKSCSKGVHGEAYCVPVSSFPFQVQKQFFQGTPFFWRNWFFAKWRLKIASSFFEWLFFLLLVHAGITKVLRYLGCTLSWSNPLHFYPLYYDFNARKHPRGSHPKNTPCYGHPFKIWHLTNESLELKGQA